MAVNETPIDAGVSTRLDASRRDLLDLGLRNTLLNYRPLRSRGVEVTAEAPAEVFRLLVREGKTLTFQPTPERTQLSLDAATPATATPAPPPADAAPPSDVPAKQPDSPAAAGTPQTSAQPEAAAPAPLTPDPKLTDRYLQTSLQADQLQTRLLNTFYAARTFIEEQGVNILYIVLGMLEWYETDSSTEKRRAPLLLVPVTLERSDARDRFRLLHSGEDIGDNLSLAAMLQANFGITLPELPELEDLQIDAYFSAIADAVESRPRWTVDRDAVALGFFSFGKFLMYRDLDPGIWPAEAQPETHPIIRALLLDGFHDPAPTIGDDDFLDTALQPGDLHEVLDADSSQQLAIVDARAGRNLVIQGPPGTGKSQTITNLIAEAIAGGKRVLFVAEKMAALEVVKRRLDAIGLGEACLELHSHKINKRAVLAELQRTLELGRPQLNAAQQQLVQLADARARLNAYCDAINDVVGTSGVSPFLALGQLVELRRDLSTAAWPRLDVPGIADWSAADATRRAGVVAEFQARLPRMGLPVEHPFWGVGLTTVLPTDEPRLSQLVTRAADAEAGLRAASNVLAERSGLPAPSTRDAAAHLAAAGRRILAAPDLADCDVTSTDWLDPRGDLRALLEAGMARSDLHARHAATLTPDAWSADVGDLRRDLAAYQDSWWRVLSGTYRRAKRTLAGYLRGPAPGSIAAQVALLDDVQAAQQADARIAELSGLGTRLFGSLWAGPTSDWPRLTALSSWLAALHRDEHSGDLPAGTVAAVAAKRGGPELEQATVGLEQALAHSDEALDAVVSAFAFDPERRFGTGATLAGEPFEERRALLDGWATQMPRLGEMTAFNISARACSDDGMAPLVQTAATWPGAGANLGALLRRTRAEALLDRAFRERPALASFDGDGHAEVIERFRKLDTLQFAYNRAALAALHWDTLPRAEGGGQLAVLRREFEKRSRHLPVRQLMLRAGAAIQAIKPVFMMSPLSVATYLPAGAVTFDLVVFDEASQVRPVDAFGALLRGSQAIVVGDDKQLPPTSFFDTLTQADGDEAPEDGPATSDYQSVLNLFLAQSAPKRMLRWHYRSKHASLIAVSNQEFYENRLVVFPSPDTARSTAGLIYHHLKDTAYERGGTRTNRDEARIVAQAVLAHAHEHPELTLGVAAFSVSQTQAILDELELLRRADPSAEPFFSAHPTEPFFVKNLENVQGDERDVIFISIGYGRTAEGYLSMNFGPLNGAGGERRLNVLITRAKLRCEVFTNLTDDDIDLSRSDAAGVRALKGFLRYARTGILDVPVASGREADSPFEEAVEAALTGAGYTIERQVGSAGFFIDLAVVDPQQPGRYLLGIECDGAAYHSARSARDRDRGRQGVLERLGWRIHRIWSIDWFRNPDEELRRAVAAIETARAGGSISPTSGAPPPTPIPRLAAEPAPPAEALPAYTVARLRANTRGQDLHEVEAATLARWVADVVEVESPVHSDEVIRRITSAAGAGRTGTRIHSAITYAIALAAARNDVVIRDGFLWSPEMQEPPLRDRSTLEGPGRDLALVAPEEIALAIVQVVRTSYGIDRAQIAPAVARLFGFQRVTEPMRAEIDPLIGTLLADGRLAEQAGQLRIGQQGQQ